MYQFLISRLSITDLVYDFHVAFEMVELTLKSLAARNPEYIFCTIEVVKPSGHCFTYTLKDNEWISENAIRRGYSGPKVRYNEKPNGGWIKGTFAINDYNDYVVTVVKKDTILQAHEFTEKYPDVFC